MKILKFLLISFLLSQPGALISFAQTPSDPAVTADPSRAIDPSSLIGEFGSFDLVSRSYDRKTFALYHSTIDPSIGGVDASEGQFVVYMTDTEVDPKHGDRFRQIIWFDRGNGKTAVVSHALDGFGGNNDSYTPTIDYKGSSVAFESIATNLVKGDNNSSGDIFVWSLKDDVVRCVTCRANHFSMDASISGDGNYVAFISYASNLTAGIRGNLTPNAYFADLRTGKITLLSKNPKTGRGGGGIHPSVSEDGSRVAFWSDSDKLVEGDKNKYGDIFVWERGNPKLKRISLTASGQKPGQISELPRSGTNPMISGNGKYVAFSTYAANMVSEPARWKNVYVAEIDTGKIIRASENVDKIGGNYISPSDLDEKIAISYDGKWVAFTTEATNLGGKMILKNIETGEIIPIITKRSGVFKMLTLSRNGKCVAFSSDQELDKRFRSRGIFATCR